MLANYIHTPIQKVEEGVGTKKICMQDSVLINFPVRMERKRFSQPEWRQQRSLTVKSKEANNLANISTLNNPLIHKNKISTIKL